MTKYALKKKNYTAFKKSPVFVNKLHTKHDYRADALLKIYLQKLFKSNLAINHRNLFFKDKFVL